MSPRPATHASPEPGRRDPPSFDGFPTYHAYQTARKRELTRARIRNLRATNRHLSLKEIAYHTGVSVHYVKEVLAGPGDLPCFVRDHLGVPSGPSPINGRGVRGEGVRQGHPWPPAQLPRLTNDY